MGWAFNAFAGELLSSDATRLRFGAGSDMPASYEIHIVGSGLSFDEATGSLVGTINSLELFDPSLGPSGGVQQTISIDAADVSTLAGTITTFLAQALVTIADTFTAWNLVAGGFDHFDNPVFAGTSLTVELQSAGNALIGYLKIEGTNLTDATLDTTGTITKIIHLDAAGDPVPTDAAADYTAAPIPFAAFDYGLLSIGVDTGNDEVLYPVLVSGNNTITKNDAANAFHVFEGGAGNDQFVATTNSIVDYFNATAGVTVSLGTGSATGGAGNDAWTANLFGAVRGSQFNDSLTGRNSASLGDELRGNSGNDTLTGLNGKDLLFGGDGLDKLVGGLGRDTMEGGAQKDVFDFNLVTETGKTATTCDKITDFKHLTDDIDLKTIDANGSAAGNTAFKFLAAKGAAFTGVQGKIHWFQINAAGTANDKTIIEGDVNGDRKADFQIELTGLVKLTAGDFIL